jgi:hypothetical protein
MIVEFFSDGDRGQNFTTSTPEIPTNQTSHARHFFKNPFLVKMYQNDNINFLNDEQKNRN